MNDKKNVILNVMGCPIEYVVHTGKGRPRAILHIADAGLTNRQQAILEELPRFDSRIIVRKRGVSMIDLAAFTAKTGDEFAMFTKGPKRLIVRGDEGHVNITETAAAKLSAQGYKWSGHTHPGYSGLELLPSEEDKEILKKFDQKESAIYNSKGDYLIFDNMM
jgi:hypothetical protein